MAAGVRPRRGYADGRHSRRTRRSAATRSSSSPTAFATVRSIPSIRRRSTESAPKACTSPTATRCFPRRRCRTPPAIATGHYPGDTGQFANQILHRLSAVSDRELRPASRHDGARRRRSVRARGHQRSLRRQLLARSVAARVCAILRLQHGRSRKDRACRSAGCVGS